VTQVSRIVIYGAPLVGMDLNKLKRVPRWQRRRKWRGPRTTTPPSFNASPTDAERHQKLLSNFRQELLFQSFVNESSGFDQYYKTNNESVRF
jgi:hypothetical protein